MMRACVFLLGALAVALIAGAAVMVVAVVQSFRESVIFVIAVVLAVGAFAFALPVSAIAGSIDGLLSRGLPVVLRAPVTAMAGAIVAHFLAAFLVSRHPPAAYLVTYAAIACGAIMGVCSALSEYIRK